MSLDMLSLFDSVHPCKVDNVQRCVQLLTVDILATLGDNPQWEKLNRIEKFKAPRPREEPKIQEHWKEKK